MPFFKRSEVLSAYNRHFALQTKSADQILRESAAKFDQFKTYHVFLSHAREDARLILGIKAILEDQGYTSYVDWIDDPQLNRASVTAANAHVLRVRMKNCQTLLFVTSQAASNSKWMPWELGYFDGLKNGAIAILPLLADSENAFQGQEYLGLYPVVEKDASGKLILPKSAGGLMSLREFVAGGR